MSFKRLSLPLALLLGVSLSLRAETPVPTDVPTDVPTAIPTDVPTTPPTAVPTDVPTPVPTVVPTDVPTPIPTDVPTAIPTTVPTLDTPTQTATVTITYTQTPTLTQTPIPPTVPATATAVPPTPVLTNTPVLRLDLQVQRLSSLNQSQAAAGFEITNRGSQPVPVDQLKIQIWVSNNLGSITTDNFQLRNSAGQVQGSVSANVTNVSIPPQTCPSGRVANYRYSVNLQGSGSIPVNGALRSKSNGVSWHSASPQDYSRLDSSVSGFFGNNAYFVLTYNGLIVREWSSSTSGDPNTGLAPCGVGGQIGF